MPISTLFVGIDVSERSNQVCAINFNQDEFFNKSFVNSPSGCELMINKLIEVMKENEGLKKIEICLESTGVFHFHVANYLARDDRLSRYGCKVYPMNAKSIAVYKKSYIELEKHDPGDAFICADFVRVGRCKNSQSARDFQKFALQRLTRQRKNVAEAIANEKKRALNNLFLKYSDLLVSSGDESYFNHTFSHTLMHILTDYISVEDIIDASYEELIDKVCEYSKNRFSDPEAAARAIKKMARDSYRLDKVAADALNVTLACQFRLIETYKDEMKTLDKEIERLVRGFKDNYFKILMSIPGFGIVCTAGIIAEIEDICLFKDSGHLASYGGYRWKRKQSGEKESENTRQPYASNTYFRYYITEATSHLIKHDSEYNVFYHRKYNEVPKNQHKRALVLTTRKCIRLVFGLLRRNQLFDPSHLDTVSV